MKSPSTDPTVRAPLRWGALLSLVLAGASLGQAGQVVGYEFLLQGSQEVPPNPSTAIGNAQVTLNPLTGQFTWKVTFSGLTSPQTAAHFHAALPGVNGPIAIPIPNGSPSTGSVVVTAAQVNQILNGGWYLNVHSTMFPGGEIRGQVVNGPNISSVVVKCGAGTIGCCPDPIKICTGGRLEWCVEANCPAPVQVSAAGPGPGFPFNAIVAPGASTPASPPYLVPGSYPVVLNMGGITTTCTVKVIETMVTPRNGGNGCDGPFEPTGNVTLDTTQQSEYNFTRVTIPAGVTVRLTGPNPITIKSRGKVLINGTLDASGFSGAVGGNGLPGGAGGAGGPGGGAGGAGASAGTGSPGLGVSPGLGGMDLGLVGGSFTETVGGGGGGGNATAGAMGGPPNSGSILGNGSGAGGPAVPVCRAGSGGGGGGGDADAVPPSTANDGGSGGGGGGGWLCLYSDQVIVVGPAGMILSNGGAGGVNSGNGGAGGGGSGGRVELTARGVCISGIVSAVGGAGGPSTQTNCGCSAGGAGGDGCVAVSGDLCVIGGGTVVPPPSVCEHGLVLTAACPTAYLDVWSDQNRPYIAALSATCGPPIVIPPFCPPFELNFLDSLFMLTFPVNTLAPIVTGLSGPPANRVCIDLSMLALPPGLDLKLYIQAISLDPILPGGIGGISCKTPIMLKF